MTKALSEDMKGTSAPGVDEFTVNFICKCWDSLGALVCNAVNKCKSKNKFTSTLRTAIFKLLRKGDKIAHCVIRNRILKVILLIIGKQQKAYVPDDNIESVLINLLSTMQECNQKKLLD